MKEIKFTEILDRLLASKEMSRSALGKELNIAGSTMQSWYSRDGSTPNSVYALQIAEYFGITVEYLLTGANLPDRNIILSPDEQHLLDAYQMLDAEDQKVIDATIDALIARYVVQLKVM